MKETGSIERNLSCRCEPGHSDEGRGNSECEKLPCMCVSLKSDPWFEKLGTIVKDAPFIGV